MTKAEILEQICSELKAQLRRIVEAARESQRYATDQDSKAEGKYDTRSLEASYLARGQAAKAEELAEAISLFESLDLPDFEPNAPIGLGALVEAELDGEHAFYLLAPSGGGTTCRHEGAELTVLTPSAPLFQNLEGKRAGEQLEQPVLTIRRVQ